MRCYCCNKALSSFESTRKSATTGEYLDMCNKCYGTIKNEAPAIERADLATEEDYEDEYCQEDGSYFSDYEIDEDSY